MVFNFTSGKFYRGAVESQGYSTSAYLHSDAFSPFCAVLPKAHNYRETVDRMYLPYMLQF